MTSIEVVGMIGIPVAALITAGLLIKQRNETLGIKVFAIGLAANVLLFVGWGVYGIWFVANHLCY